MKLHPDMFKIPKIVFDDAESSSALGKTVSRILSNIRGTVKTAVRISTAFAMKLMWAAVDKVARSAIEYHGCIAESRTR